MLSANAGWAQLHEMFLTRLAVRAATLEATLPRIASGEPGAREDLERQFHSLAGIGGTFGHHDLTELARRGEQQCGEGADVALLRGAVAAVVSFAASAASVT